MKYKNDYLNFRFNMYFHAVHLFNSTDHNRLIIESSVISEVDFVGWEGRDGRCALI